MTDPSAPPDVVDDGVSDVMQEDEVVHVPAAVAEQAESLEHPPASFVTEIEDWDEPIPAD